MEFLKKLSLSNYRGFEYFRWKEATIVRRDNISRYKKKQFNDLKIHHWI